MAGVLLGMGVAVFAQFADPFSGFGSNKGAAGGAVSGEQLESVRSQLRDAARQVQYLNGLLDSTDTELAVERSARFELEDELRALSTMAGQVQNELALYEQLLPPGPQGVVSIRGARFEAGADGLRYRVLLGRSARRGTPAFRGRLQFVAQGMSNGRRHTVVLLPAMAAETNVVGAARANAAPCAGSGVEVGGSTIAEVGDEAAAAVEDRAVGAVEGNALSRVEAEAVGRVRPRGSDHAAISAARPASLQLNFEQHQRSEGILGLQQGFTPESVTVSAVQDGVVRASRSVPVILIRPAAAL